MWSWVVLFHPVILRFDTLLSPETFKLSLEARVPVVANDGAFR